MTTKAQTGHTPTPWTWYIDDEPEASNPNMYVSRKGYGDICSIGGGQLERRIADAVFIVRAVNSFDELVEVVEAMANFDGRNITTHLKEMARDALKKAQP